MNLINFEINDQLDLFRAKQLLNRHKESLINLTDERTIWYTKSIIGKIEACINGYINSANILSNFEDGDNVKITIKYRNMSLDGIVRKGNYITRDGQYLYVTSSGVDVYTQSEIISIKIKN